jgi:glycolate oxidase FAD binding subunit
MSTSAALTREECRSTLASIAGGECVGDAGDAITVAASDSAQISEILRFANSNGISVSPIGSGSKQGWGNEVDAGIRLDLSRMNKLREHAWQDMTCTVEAGCTWAAMQAELAKHGQMVALDPLWPERATLGGIVATNDGGCLRLKYGGLRDLIIGMTVVLADGTVAKTGGKVVKNVAGYDLHKLMTGSFGTLGVITEINFRLHPRETYRQTWIVEAPDSRQFKEPLRDLLDSQLTPPAVQLRSTANGYELGIAVAAPAECIGEHTIKLNKIFSGMDLKQSDESAWLAREQMHNQPGDLVLKVSTLPSEICALAAELNSWAGEGGDRAVDFVAQANGLAAVAIRSEIGEAVSLVKHLRQRLSSSGGGVVALHVPQAVRGTFDVWGCESNALPLMKEIKRRFDSNGILNPGRFVGNI